MSNGIFPKRSTVAAKVPTTSSLAPNELAINSTDQKIYTNNGSAIVQIGSGKLAGLADVALTSLTSGQNLSWNGTNWVNSSASGSGTVTSVAATAGTGISVTGSPITTSGTLTITNTAPDQIVALTAGTGVSVSGTYPNFTITNTAPSSGGTVTSVTGTAPVVSSGGNTPAISIPAATTSVSGYLTSTDWNTFNGKQPAGTYVNSVSGTTGRITSTGGTTPVIDLASGIATAGTTGSSTLIPVVTIDTYGRVTGITTAANPQGTVTSVTGTAPIVSSGGNTPAISITQATTSTNGYLSSTDWNTFNNKQAAGSYVTVGGALGTPSSGNLANCTFPTLNQNTTGTASNITGTYTGSISSSQVTTGLGFTPYNSSNPSGYITSSGTSAACSGNAATVSSITGNTALMVNSLAAPAFIDGLTTSNFRATLFNTTSYGYQVSTSRWNATPTFLNPWLGNYGTMLAWSGSDTHGFIAMNYSGQGAVIGGGNAQNINWYAALLDSSNYNSYSPTLTGGGASGTWGISVTGSSGSCTGNSATASNPASGGSFITSSNIGSQSVSYASTAGSASTASSATSATTSTNTFSGKTWHNVTSSRAINTTYTNSNSFGIWVIASFFWANGSAFSGYYQVSGSNVVYWGGGNYNGGQPQSFWVPAGATYYCSVGGGSITNWWELY